MNTAMGHEIKHILNLIFSTAIAVETGTTGLCLYQMYKRGEVGHKALLLRVALTCGCLSFLFAVLTVDLDLRSYGWLLTFARGLTATTGYFTAIYFLKTKPNVEYTFVESEKADRVRHKKVDDLPMASKFQHTAAQVLSSKADQHLALVTRQAEGG